MAKPVVRITAIQAAVLAGFVVLVLRAAQVQVRDAEAWRRLAESRRLVTQPVVAERGTISDRDGSPLAVSQTFYHVGLALNETPDAAALLARTARALGLPRAELARRAGTRRYLYLHGPFTASQVELVRRMAGVHLTPLYRRAYPSGGVARPLLGRFDPEAPDPTSGLEQAFDSLLRGEPGETVFLRDARGRLYESPGREIRAPVPGGSVVLTLDSELQAIAEDVLREAVAAYDAAGGDLLLMDVHTGEILASASYIMGPDTRAGPSATVFTSTFEPGSTAKLFTAAALLSLDRVDSTAAVSGENGRWAMPITGTRVRIIEDTHAESGALTLEEAIRVSSNIAMAKFSLRLQPAEQFDVLRAFGFGTPTGVEFPGETPGRLTRPDRWEPRYSGPSHAIGYEFGVSVLQLAAAYAAIANDGILLAPALVREIRDAEGVVRYRHTPRIVRRVVSPAVASTLRRFLLEAASAGGTGARAQLAATRVLGKTGTARLYEQGAYQPGKFTASFAGLFPADAPQFVIIAKLTDPRGSFGGLTAAPLTRRMLEAALAARQNAVNRGRAVATLSPKQRASNWADRERLPVQVAVFPPPADTGVTRRATVSVPDVVGLSARDAAWALHRRGLHVRLSGTGTVEATVPAAGTPLAPGSIVRVRAGDPR